jgi:outer membrane protein W
MINYQLRLNELVYGDESISTNNQEAASAAAAAAAAADDSASSSTQFRITAFNREQQKSEEINFGTSMLEKKAIRKTIMPTLAFFFLWIPFVLVQSISLFANFNNNFIDKANLIAMSIAYLHSTINPIIYSFTNKEINKTIMAKSNRNAHI